MADLPAESEKLLAVAPDDFVAERQRIARELRDAGRAADAAAVAAIRKPSAVVLAVNRSARDRPKAAQGAAEAAERVEKAQAGGDLDAFREAMSELDRSLDLLSDVAVAHVGQPGKRTTDAMRRRVHDLLRRAVASKGTRDALSRGVLIAEPEAAGFAAFAGIEVKAGGRKRAAPARSDARAKRREAERQKQEKALRAELSRAEKALEGAEKAARSAERERAKAERAVASTRAKLDRLA